MAINLHPVPTDFEIPAMYASPAEWAQAIHHNNKLMGWWDKPRDFGTLTMLICSEFSEAMEGLRKDLNDDHLPQYKMFDVELADAAIRTLDLAGRIMELGHIGPRIFQELCAGGAASQNTMHILSGLGPGLRPMYTADILCGRLPQTYGEVFPSTPRAMRIPALLNELTQAAAKYGSDMETSNAWWKASGIVSIFISIVHVARICEVPLVKIMQEKLKYNQTRADHQRENRQKEGGKAF